MQIQLITPAPLRLNNGNKITALRWARILRHLGHKVNVQQSYGGARCDLLIALHARRSYPSIEKFHRLHPALPLIVVLTGTDLYRDIRTDGNAKRSLELATRLVALQKMALVELPKRFHSKTRIIYQSAAPYRDRASRPEKAIFQVCLIGHLREEKDPLRAALAVRCLPPESRIRVMHIGLALNDDLEKQARAETARNPRYRWLGALPHWKTRRILAQSNLAVITSRMEGSSNVLSEALASSVPVVVSKIPGLMGTLGNNFPGYFPVGNTQRLAEMLLKSETDAKFYRRLKHRCARLSHLVKPQREFEAWHRLLHELGRGRKHSSDSG
ncbi:MAG TPA: selenoneine biosynthesis selenosugar synthase SenB [Candidatus Binatia bacterium]|nr:selenoneine biosynthesis selenosugar synthase SenB [Candidatus Binatia bacterium]